MGVKAMTRLQSKEFTKRPPLRARSLRNAVRPACGCLL